MLPSSRLSQKHTKATILACIPLEFSNLRLLTYFIIFALYISFLPRDKTLYHLVNDILSVLGTKSIDGFNIE